MLKTPVPGKQYTPFGQILGPPGDMPDFVLSVNTPGGHHEPAGQKYDGNMRPGKAHTRPTGHNCGKPEPNPGQIVPAVQVEQIGAPCVA